MSLMFSCFSHLMFGEVSWFILRHFKLQKEDKRKDDSKDDDETEEDNNQDEYDPMEAEEAEDEEDGIIQVYLVFFGIKMVTVSLKFV